MKIGPCAKATVRCRLLDDEGYVVATGYNYCRNPQPVCPRLPGEDYTKCKTVCDQIGHAEVVALAAAGLRAGSSLRAEVTGHTYACSPCTDALNAAGITDIVVRP